LTSIDRISNVDNFKFARMSQYGVRVQHCFGFSHGGGEFALVAQ